MDANTPVTDDVSAWIQPIGVDTPAGEDARYGARFVHLRSLISQLESPSGEPVDWHLVAELAAGILKHEAKDLQAACYLAIAWARTDSTAGLLRGLTLLDLLTRAYADVMFPSPTRLRRRERIMAWYVGELERLSTGQATELGVWGSPSLEILPQVFERLGVQGPSLRGLHRAHERRRVSPKQPREAPKPKPAARPSSPSTQPTTVDVSTFEEPRKAHLALNQKLVSMSHRLRAADPKCPAGYQVLCFGLWSHLCAATPAVTRPLATAPLDRLLQSQTWLPLVDEAVAKLVQARLQLEFAGYAVVGLASLGESYRDAAAALTIATKSLLLHVPGLQQSAVERATNPEVVQWLTDLTTVKSAEEEHSSPSEASPVAQPTSPRERFLHYLDFATDLVNRGKLEHGAMTYYGLWREAEAKSLVQWEPELVVRCLQGYLAACRTKTIHTRGELSRVYERLAQLSPQIFAAQSPEIFQVAG